MGSSSSKFRKHLVKGDEYAALQIYGKHSDVRKNLDPNHSFGEHHNNDTALHFASKNAMKALVRYVQFSYLISFILYRLTT